MGLPSKHEASPHRSSSSSTSTMMKDEAQNLLCEGSKAGLSDVDLYDVEDNFHHEPQQKTRRPGFFQAILLVMLLISNLAWFLRTQKIGNSVNESLYNQVNYYSPPETKMVGFYHEWVNVTQEYADKKWEDLFPSGGGTVAIDRSLAIKHRIPPAVESLRSPGKMVYTIAGWHQLHCMDMVRRQLEAAYSLNSEPDVTLRSHIYHCVEAVRQALHCSLDPTLINLGPKWPFVPDGQEHLCRNADAIFRFAEENQHPLPGHEFDKGSDESIGKQHH